MIKDLVVDRGALDRIIAAGGFISAPTGGAQDANSIPVPKAARRRRDGCRRVHRLRRVRRRVSRTASASLFTAAKISHLGHAASGAAGAIPPRARDGRADGRRGVRRTARSTASARRRVPKEISIDTIARMNRDFMVATVRAREEKVLGGTG